MAVFIIGRNGSIMVANFQFAVDMYLQPFVTFTETNKRSMRVVRVAASTLADQFLLLLKSDDGAMTVSHAKDA
jgi:hypothetical protein